jgi:hypothetical protein
LLLQAANAAAAVLQMRRQQAARNVDELRTVVSSRRSLCNDLSNQVLFSVRCFVVGWFF